MGFLEQNLASTPCCGLIKRSVEWIVSSEHENGGYYAGDRDFEYETDQLSRAICPDCGRSFRAWLAEHGRLTPSGWRWDYSLALTAFSWGQDNQGDYITVDGISEDGSRAISLESRYCRDCSEVRMHLIVAEVALCRELLIGFLHPGLQEKVEAAELLATKRIGFGEFKRVLLENS